MKLAHTSYTLWSDRLILWSTRTTVPHICGVCLILPDRFSTIDLHKANMSVSYATQMGLITSYLHRCWTVHYQSEAHHTVWWMCHVYLPSNVSKNQYMRGDHQLVSSLCTLPSALYLLQQNNKLAFVMVKTILCICNFIFNLFNFIHHSELCFFPKTLFKHDSKILHQPVYSASFHVLSS